MHQWKPLHLAAMHQSFESMKFLSLSLMNLQSRQEARKILLQLPFTVA